VFGFLRVDEKPILLKCQILNPDQEIIFDLSLADEGEVIREVKPGGTVLVNTGHGIDHFRNWRSLKIGLVDAATIAGDAGLSNTFNTAILGAYARLTGLVKMETLLSVVRGMVPAKIDANIKAVERSYDEVKIYLPEGKM
jgi:2-oxoacid:acceptor oxidoreductase gamma subunit (pyruvate/2-ketoisovalerate family)